MNEAEVDIYLFFSEHKRKGVFNNFSDNDIHIYFPLASWSDILMEIRIMEQSLCGDRGGYKPKDLK